MFLGALPMTTVACISGVRFDPDQGYSTTRSMIYPGKTRAATYTVTPFKLTTVNLRDINQWIPTVKGLPQAQYANKIIVATPVKIDVDVQPICPICGSEADFALDSETKYCCLQKCDASEEDGPFEAVMNVSGTIRLHIDDGPVAFPAKIFAPDFATFTGFNPDAFAKEGYLPRIRLLEDIFLHKKRAFHVRMRKGTNAERTLIAVFLAEELPDEAGSPSKKVKSEKGT